MQKNTNARMKRSEQKIKKKQNSGPSTLPVPKNARKREGGHKAKRKWKKRDHSQLPGKKRWMQKAPSVGKKKKNRKVMIRRSEVPF